MEESRDAYTLDRIHQLTEPEIVVDNLGSFGMQVSSSFDPNWAPSAISAWCLTAPSIVSHDILEERATPVSSWQVISFPSSVNF